jgi:hypothetical protein
MGERVAVPEPRVIVENERTQIEDRGVDDRAPIDLRVHCGLRAAAGGARFLHSFFDGFTGFAGALLNPANQLVLLALDELEIIIGELGPLLLELALGDVPVAFDFECIHICIYLSVFVLLVL